MYCATVKLAFQMFDFHAAYVICKAMDWEIDGSFCANHGLAHYLRIDYIIRGLSCIHNSVSLLSWNMCPIHELKGYQKL